MKKIIAVLLLLTLALTACTALADTTKVVYEGKKDGAGQFTVISKDQDDLFDNFKNLMPGDTLDQNIVIQNNSNHRIRVYMHAETVPTEDPEGFLSELRLRVGNAKGVIFDDLASEDELDTPMGQQITAENKAYLGTFGRFGATGTITATLEIPFELDNAYQKARGEVVWIFTIEELPNDESPDTGDDFTIGLWLGVMAALIAAIAAVLVLLKRRRNEA